MLLLPKNIANIKSQLSQNYKIIEQKKCKDFNCLLLNKEDKYFFLLLPIGLLLSVVLFSSKCLKSMFFFCHLTQVLTSLSVQFLATKWSKVRLEKLLVIQLLKQTKFLK